MLISILQLSKLKTQGLFVLGHVATFMAKPGQNPGVHDSQSESSDGVLASYCVPGTVLRAHRYLPVAKGFS